MTAIRTLLVMVALLVGVVVLLPADAQDAVDCSATLEIRQIQGSGSTANCLGQRVTTAENIVTGVGPGGFFMQTPPERAGDDAAASDGIYVVTNLPPVAWDIEVGDLVTLTDVRVSELFDLSTLEVPSAPRITVISSDNPLPEPVDLTQADLDWTPAPDAVHPLERYEGMRVIAEDVLVTAPTNQFDEFGISLTGERVFRQMGLEWDNLTQLAGLGLPLWNLSPELLEVDPLEMGRPVMQIVPGSRVTLVGNLAYAFRDYQIWPSEIEVLLDVELEPAPVPEPAEGEFTVATFNVENLFDTTNDPNRDDGAQANWTPASEADYQVRLAKLSAYIREVLRAPDILALQEVENHRTLAHLAHQISADAPDVQYTLCLLEGNESRGIDVAYLVRVDRVNVLDCYRMPGSFEATQPGTGSALFSRPPLVLEAEYVGGGGQSFPLTLINLHIKSMSGIETQRVQTQRLLQATVVANYVQGRLNADPDANLVVLGDLNAFQFSDGLTDVVGIIAGTHDPDEALLAPPEPLVQPSLVNQVERLPAEERYSYIFNGAAQVLDHILTSPALDAYVTGAAYGRGNADGLLIWELDADTGALRVSDHDGMVMTVAPVFE
ncbi:MAG: endonuclease/exonuclease/phosphatase family protein [Phototrophicaceae bacterium]